MFKRFVRDETGATAIEYGLIAGAFTVSIVGSVTALGGSYESMYEKIKNVMIASTSSVP